MKPFDPNLYNEDDSAKDVFIDWLTVQGWTAWVNPDQYGIDVLAIGNNWQECQFEVEVKHNWSGDKFPFDTLHFAGRKRKFLTGSKDVVFVTFNHERTHALAVSGKVLAGAPIVYKKTKYTNNEPFIEVAADRCKLLKIGN